MSKGLTKISEIIYEISMGPFGSDIKVDNFVESGVPVLNGANLQKFKLLENEFRYVTADKAKTFRKAIAKRGDIIVTHRGTIGQISYVPEDSKFEEYVISQSQFRVALDKKIVDPAFFVYYFHTNEGQKRLLANKCHVGVPALAQATTNFRLIEIPLPNIQTQHKIASVLSALDSKIELNNCINTELEAMAKTLYDYWFVQFDFPDENGKPYKTSGGKMVWNEEMKMEIPEGFLNCKLGDVLARTGTGLNPRENFVLGEGNNYYVTIKNIEQGRVILDNKCDKITDTSLEIINKRSDLKIGDILFTSIEPVGITYLILEKPKNWNINESVFTIRPNYEKVTSEFLYMFLSGDYIKSYTKNVSAGSIHKGIRHSLLKDCKFILPERNIVDAFTMKIQPILNYVDIIQKENQKLTELRDWLLPMLMNGQVTVN
jgi:type I restriction enzyme S subunit